MKYIYTLLFVAISAISFAQGNLQFNQVINITGVTPGGRVFTTVTVPAGKVWKITSSTWMQAGSYLSDFLCLGPHLLSGYYNGETTSKYPIWLPEGDYDVQYCSPGSGVSGREYAISGIEFNIVP